jgi:hypothetical protein
VEEIQARKDEIITQNLLKIEIGGWWIVIESQNVHTSRKSRATAAGSVFFLMSMNKVTCVYYIYCERS